MARSRRLGLSLRRELLAGTAIIVVGTLVPVALGDLFWAQVLLLVDLYVIAAVSLNILRGEAGQISFGQGAIFGAAAYATAMAAGLYGVPIAPAMMIGAVAGLTFGVLLGLPALRVQGYYLGFVTLAAAVALPELLLAYNDVTFAITGISVLVPGVGEPLIWRLDWLTLTILVATVLALGAHALIRSSRFGRQMRVAANSPEAALSLGISPGRMRLVAFALAALGTGIAGALYVPVFGFVSPGAFPLYLSILLYFAVVVGGHGTLIGPITGIFLLYIVPNVLLSGLARYRLIIYGGIALVTMLFFPDGLITSLRDRLRRRSTVERDRPFALVQAIAESGRLPKGAKEQVVGSEPVLSVHSAERRFGQVRALDGASLQVRPGEIHGVVGPNGSGKTTLLNAISGLIRLDAGRITVGSVDITDRNPRHRAELGIGRTFQTPRVIEDMSVWENIAVAGAGAESEGAVPADLEETWDRVPASSLPHAQRRSLELARALAAQPHVYLLDEPAAGLSPQEREEFGSVLRQLATRRRAAIVLVEHDLNLVWGIANTVSVMDQGRVIASGTPDELGKSADVQRLFAGAPGAAG